MLVRFLSVLLMVLGSLRGDLAALSFRNALQMPEFLIGEINDAAISVNETQALDLMGVGASFEKSDSVICAFPENKAGVVSADSIAHEIMHRFSKKEIVLTGYRKAAQYAGAVASRLNQEPLAVNQLKLIAFCGEEPFDRLDGMYLSCRLNFSHRFVARNYQNSPWIELPISFSSELCSIRSVVAGTVGGLVCGTLGGLCTQGVAWGMPFTLVCVLLGVVVPPVGMSCCIPSEYLPSKGVQAVFVRAKNKSWRANADLDWRLLGQ